MPDTQREALELRKLELEVADLRKHWILKPSITAPLATIIAAVFAVVWAGFNGWFSIKLDALHNAQDKAEISLQEMDDKRSALNAEIAQLTSERNGLAQNLKQVLTSAQALQAEVKATTAKEAHCEQSRAELDRLSAQLKTNLNQLSSPQTATATSGVWHMGDIVQISIVQKGGGPPPEMTVSYPLSGEEITKIKNTPKYSDLPIEVPDCSFGNEYGKCSYKVGRAAMVLRYFQVKARAPSLDPSSEYETVNNGTRQLTVTMTGSRGPLN